MGIRKRLIGAVVLLGLAATAPLHAAGEGGEEGVRTGVIQQVDEAAGIVVIDDQRYRTYGNRVQPRPGISSESNDYRTRPFERGMIVRFSVGPGSPPIIREAWALD